MIDKSNLPNGTNEVKDKATTTIKLTRDKSMRIIIDITADNPMRFTITQGSKKVTQDLTKEPTKEIDDILNTPLKDLIADYTQFFNEV